MMDFHLSDGRSLGQFPFYSMVDFLNQGAKFQQNDLAFSKHILNVLRVLSYLTNLSHQKGFNKGFL